MQLTITSVDYAPEELDEQLPIVVDLIRELPGDDRPDYWLGVVKTPIRWRVEGQVREVTHVVLAARWVGTTIGPGAHMLPVGIGFVTDQSLLDDGRLDFAKTSYVAIGMCSESDRLGLKRASAVLKGVIATIFGLGKQP